MQSTAATVDEYLETVPLDRAGALAELRQLCLSNLVGYKEGMDYGMPSYSKDGVTEVGFNSQKHYISLYILNKQVVDKYRDQLKDVGKGCIRYRKPEHIDFTLIEQMLDEVAVSTGLICP
jgi:uncharacterized protein YdhG (YjbR/CyaY superfamily)